MQPIWKPESKTKGRDYMKWVNSICKYGYNHNYKILNCADYGDPTKRFRYFGIFAKEGLKIKFPNPTHSDPKKIKKIENLQQDLFSSNTLRPWRPVRECLELDNTGQSIFSRKKGLVEKSLRRIYAGLIKYVMDNDKEVEEFIENIYSDCTNYFQKADALLIPLLNNEKDSIKPFITKYNSNSPTTGISVPQDIDNPSSTVCTHGRLGIVQAFLAGYYSSPNIKADNGKLNSIDNPSPSITTIPHESIVFIKKYDTAFISSFHGGENQHNRNYSVENPHLTVTTNNKEALVFIAKYYGQENQSVNSSSIEAPSPTLTTVDRLSMISCHHYLINPQYNNTVSSIDKPCFTIIARMDKAPVYLANTERLSDCNELLACMEVCKEDSPYMVRIKLCMALYGLADIKMRMLTIPELKQIQSFPKNYVLIGTQAEQKKYIGNAVPSNTVMNLVKCLAI